MDGGIKLGTIWGIPVRMHLSWVVIIIFMTWTLAAGYFPQRYPPTQPLVYWISGFLTSVLFALSVLLHEIGHAYSAIRNRVPVKSITLYIFGGVAEISQEPPTPKAELQIAIVGPAVSLALGLLFGGIGLLLRDLVPVIAAPSAWLGQVNIILALFNMIPGFPLDGGRVLRSIVWGATGEIKRATRVSSIAGQAIAFGAIGVGIYFLVRGSLFNGIWLIIIGWSLQNAAVNTYIQLNLRQTLQKAQVWQVMNRDLPIIYSDLPLDRLVNEQILTGGKRFFLVYGRDDDTLCGVVTIHNINKIQSESWAKTSADEIMIPCSEVLSVQPERTLLEALEIMDNKNVAQVPVLGAGDMVVGLLTRERILKFIRSRAETS